MNELTKQIMCLKIRGDIELWLEKERLDNLMLVLEAGKENRFIRIDEQMINTADIVGIFSAQTMEETIKRRNGQWRDSKGEWHDKGERICGGCGSTIPIGKVCGTCA